MLKVLGYMMFVKLGILIFSEDVIINVVDFGFCKGIGLYCDIYGGKLVVLVIVKIIFGWLLEVGVLVEFDVVIINLRRVMIVMLKIGKFICMYFRVFFCNLL